MIKILLKSRIVICLVVALTVLSLWTVNRADAQGVGNHLTMYLDNCSLSSPQSIEFDLMVISDGDSLSDLRANSFQYGINFNTNIIPSGDIMSISYVGASSDFIPPLSGFSFPASSSPSHIRIAQGAYTAGNTNITMVIGQPYRVGTFQLSCTAPFVENEPTNFTLQGTTAGGKTVCAGIVWIGTAISTTPISASGTGNNQRSVNANCNLVITSAKDLAEASSISIYPNPSQGEFTLSLGNLSGVATLKILNMIGGVVYSEAITEKKTTVNSHLAPGIYFAEVTSGSKRYLHKLVIE